MIMRLTIGTKVFSIAAVILALMIAAAVVSIVLTSRVGAELDAITNRHLPVSEAVSRIEINILEQEIAIQRLLVLAEAPETTPAELEAERARFDEIDRLIRRELEQVVSVARLDGRFEAAVPVATELQARYETLATLSLVVADALKSADREAFLTKRVELDSAQDAINTKLETLRQSLGQIARDSAELADRHESIALNVISVLTVLAAVLGLLFGTLVTRGLVRSVRNLVQGTVAVEGGNLDTQLEVISHDEVGRLTDSFNRMIGELRLKERIKETFGKYMDPRIVSDLLEHPEKTATEGQKQVMTVMFIDLKGFTSISEILEPGDLVNMINRFFSHMTRAISAHDGVVDKFMGDAVMAYWGPPFTKPGDHPALACRAALEALERLEEFRGDVRQELGAAADQLEIDLRIGISTGTMIVGTVGSEASKNFTVIGDPVNLGSRLEAANKAYGSRILVAGQTREGVTDQTFRELDLLRVKGKQEPIRVFELVSGDANPGAETAESISKFEQGLAHYRSSEWGDAEKCFEAVLAKRNDDMASKVYLERIRHFRSNPPPADWDGVWVMETK